MTINTEKQGNTLVVCPIGSIDVNTAPELDRRLAEETDSVQTLILDLEQVPYISSAGLRVLLRTHTEFEKKNGMRIRHASEVIEETFELLGLMDIFVLE